MAFFNKEKKEKIETNSAGGSTQEQLFKTIKETLDDMEWSYDVDNAKYVVRTGMQGDDLSIPLLIIVENNTLVFLSPLNLEAKQENYKTVTWELNNINEGIKFGKFYLDAENGRILYQFSFPYIEAAVSKKFFATFLQIVLETVDEHDGDLKKIAERTTGSAADYLYQ
jgi:hypothetical protein